MAEAHLDHPGEVTWFPNQQPATVLGECPHETCPHNEMRDIAWGPDYSHYVLVACIVPAETGGCDGQCRAWSAEYPDTNAVTYATFLHTTPKETHP